MTGGGPGLSNKHNVMQHSSAQPASRVTATHNGTVRHHWRVGSTCTGTGGSGSDLQLPQVRQRPAGPGTVGAGNIISTKIKIFQSNILPIVTPLSSDQPGVRGVAV